MTLLDVTRVEALTHRFVVEHTTERPVAIIDVRPQSSGTTVVRAAGDIDLAARGRLADALDRAASAGTDILVDLSEVTFIYSGAVGVILDAADRASAMDGADGTDSADVADSVTVRVHAPGRHVRMLFEVYGATDILTDNGLVADELVDA